MRKTLALIIIILLTVLMACSNDKDVSNNVDDATDKGQTVYEKEKKREKFATLKEVYGELIEVKEKVGPINSITVPVGTTFHSDSSAVFSFHVKDHENIPFEDAVEKDRSLTDGEIIIAGRLTAESPYTFERFMEMVENRMRGNQFGELFGVLSPDLADYPELVGFDAYRLSNHNGVMIFKILKHNEHNGNYIEIAFAMYEIAFSNEKLRAIHDIISSMEYEL